MSLLQHITSFLASYSCGNSPVYVGFSGGIDSTALLLALWQCKVPVTAVHFHHGIRGAEADADAAWCESFCQKRDIPFLRMDLQVPQKQRPGETTEEAARRLRLEQWRQLAKGKPVFLAHHADDVLEELFLRLGRGANASGLTSLRPRRVIGKVTFMRPCLEVTKDELQHFLEDNQITDWRTDSTNLQNDYRRNAIRNQLLPLIRQIFSTDAGFKQAIWALRQDADHLEQEAETTAGSHLDRLAWRTLSPALLPRVFRLWRQSQDGIDEPPSRKFLASLKAALDDDTQSDQILQLDPHHHIIIRNQGLNLQTLQDIQPYAYTWDWQRHPNIIIPEANLELSAQGGETHDGSAAESFELLELPPLLTIRSWQAGDRMVPFGHHSPKKLQDILTDAHLNHQQKKAVALLCAHDQIIWIPFVRRAEFGRTAPDKASQSIWARRLS